MKKDQRIAYVQSLCVIAQARIEGMKAENAQAEMDREDLPYGEADFDLAMNDIGMTESTIHELLGKGGEA